MAIAPIDKLRQGIIRIRGSPQRRETFRNMVQARCDKEANAHPELLRDVRVRWNSTLAMLERAIELCSAYDGFCELLATDFGRNQLNDNDWQLIRYTKRYLESFKEFIELLSGQDYPTVNVVIPAYNWLFNHLDRFCVSTDYCFLYRCWYHSILTCYLKIPREGEEQEQGVNLLRQTTTDRVFDVDDLPSAFVRETLDRAARSSFEVLRKYYSSTTQPLYAIALAMDPGCKYAWWGQARWPENWITDAKKQVADAWNIWKEEHPLAVHNEHNNAPEEQQPIRRRLKVQKRMDSQNVPDDELTSYVGEDTIDEFAESVASYWMRQGPGRARLASFAKGFLCVPATSTLSERCFSRAKFFITPTCNRLSDDNLSISVLLDSFFRFRNATQNA